MTIWQLVWKELLFTKLTSMLLWGAVAAAVGYTVSTMTLLDLQQKDLKHRVATMDDEIRKITKDMGFNINILPRNQNLVDFYAQDFASQTMPYAFVTRLADSNIATINHLRPALIQKVDWPEQRREVILMGVHGVVPWTHRAHPAPLAEAVPQGTVIVGHEIARQLQLQVSSSVTVRGRNFTVHQILPARGDKDDITLFVDLAAVQEMLQLPDRINLIQALECNCASTDRLGEIEHDIAQVLGADVQVVELSTKAIARAKARTQTELAGKAGLATAAQRGMLAIVLATVAATLLTATLFLLNVRQRAGEIALWRALGWNSFQVMTLFLTKALLLGVAGAAAGIVLGYALGWYMGKHEVVALNLPWVSLVRLDLLLGIVGMTPLLTTLASWLPALMAARQQPALILSRE